MTKILVRRSGLRNNGMQVPAIQYGGSPAQPSQRQYSTRKAGQSSQRWEMSAWAIVQA